MHKEGFKRVVAYGMILAYSWMERETTKSNTINFIFRKVVLTQGDDIQTFLFTLKHLSCDSYNGEVLLLLHVM